MKVLQELLSNSLSEVAVKPVALTRKNSLFSDSVAGAKASAIIFSIVGTANANNLDPYKYLEHIFRALPNLKFSSDDPILDDYLPWFEKVQPYFIRKYHNPDRSLSYYLEYFYNVRFKIVNAPIP